MKIKALTLLLFIAFISCNSSKKSISSSDKTIVATTNNTAIILIEGMACQEGCANKIQTNLLQIDGIEEATISYEKAKGEVVFNPNKVSSETILKTITNTKVKDYVYTIKNVEIKK
ncbi:copper chaperone CopZ [Maribacter vaceletii]|uniref:Copper chaperone CopZ n=1 Tax=Maribacter vaceletii TaxID=1206816 RepID=A0A495EGK4_9FLAO|nr:heavy metal-associated domain-containing protein [Maribacter vaceletii]RKR15067.1 copper chaperone CopZ [Maribacter vaceletii]